MSLRVYKVGDIIGNEVIPRDSVKFKGGDLAAILTNVDPVPDADEKFQWKLPLVVGVGPSARSVEIDLPSLVSRSDRPDQIPIFIVGSSLVLFCNRLYMAEREAKSATEREEIILRVKKSVYEEEADLSSLRSAVANLEAAADYRKSGPKRDPIPDDVKLVVWARDGGACRRCGSKQNLHFDHIIPVAKGGGNNAANIQILCEKCNRRKSDKII